jgi:hypothetical protein
MARNFELTLATIVVFIEVFGGIVWEMLNQPTVSEGPVGNEGDVELTCCVKKPIFRVESLKRRILGLHSVDSSNCFGHRISQCPSRSKLQRILTRVGFSQSRGRALRKSNIFCLALLAKRVQGWDGLFKGSI